MGGSMHEDYLLRQVKVIAAMLARIMGLRMSGKEEEARQELESAYGLLLGPQAEALRHIDAGSAAKLLGSEDKILALAQLFDEEAAQELDARRGAALQLHAMELGIEAARLDPEHDMTRRFLERLAPAVDRRGLSPDQLAILETCLARRSGKPDEPGS